MTRPLGGRALFAFVSPLYAAADAQVMVRYCVQCHNLPSPAMHHAAKRPVVLDRMVMRMQGGGNMGTLMRDIMEKGMEWMNRVVGNRSDTAEPQLRIEEITCFLVHHAKKTDPAADP